jgi:hypothetical protein
VLVVDSGTVGSEGMRYSCKMRAVKLWVIARQRVVLFSLGPQRDEVSSAEEDGWRYISDLK